jgi:hypothetical protein
MTTPHPILRVLFAATALAAGPHAHAEPTLDWATNENGGGLLTGSTLNIEGTLGQWDTTIMTGGTLKLEGGFWQDEGCPADFNADGFLDFFDFDDFVIAFENGAPTADFNADGFIDFFDFDDFVVAFESGC